MRNQFVKFFYCALYLFKGRNMKIRKTMAIAMSGFAIGAC